MPYLTNVTATGTVRYRFTCEQCGETTPWYSFTVTRTGTASGTGDDAASAAHSAAQKALQFRLSEIKRDAEKGRYPECSVVQGGNGEDLFKHYRCPNCQAVQSWGVSSAKSSFGKIGVFTLLLFSAYVLVYAVLACFIKSAATAVWNALGVWSLLIPVIVLVVGLIADSVAVRVKLKKELSGRGVKEKRRPEIIWNA